MDIRTKMRCLSECQDWSIWEYTPTLFRVFLHDSSKPTIKNRIKFFTEISRGGCKVYYLFVNDTPVAYAFVSRGGGRCGFANLGDIVIGPYYVFAEFRGKKYSEILVEQLLNHPDLPFINAYEWIAKDNIPSLKCADRVGFSIIGTADLSKYLRRICVRSDMNGKYYILKYTRK